MESAFSHGGVRAGGLFSFSFAGERRTTFFTYASGDTQKASWLRRVFFLRAEVLCEDGVLFLGDCCFSLEQPFMKVLLFHQINIYGKSKVCSQFKASPGPIQGIDGDYTAVAEPLHTELM